MRWTGRWTGLAGLLGVLWCLTGFPVAGWAEEELSLDLAERSVAITTGFSGAHVKAFGVRSGQQGEIAIVLRGPPRDLVVRRKRKVLGIWVNAQDVRFKDVPRYYDVAYSAPQSLIAERSTLRQHRIGLDGLKLIPAAKDQAGAEEGSARIDRFREALVGRKQQGGFFPAAPKEVQWINPSFFRADFQLPASIPTGLYKVDAYWFDNGDLIAQASRDLRVGQVGMSARLYRFATEYSLLYGLAAVIFAALFGWLANMFFRRERPG